MWQVPQKEFLIKLFISFIYDNDFIVIGLYRNILDNITKYISHFFKILLNLRNVGDILPPNRCFLCLFWKKN